MELKIKRMWAEYSPPVIQGVVDIETEIISQQNTNQQIVVNYTVCYETLSGDKKQLYTFEIIGTVRELIPLHKNIKDILLSEKDALLNYRSKNEVLQSLAIRKIQDFPKNQIELHSRKTSNYDIHFYQGCSTLTYTLDPSNQAITKI